MIEGVQDFLISIGSTTTEKDLVLDGKFHYIDSNDGKWSYIGNASRLGRRVTFHHFKTTQNKSFKEQLENLTDEERAQIIREEEADKKQRQKELLELHEAKAKSLQQEWDGYSELREGQSYLDRKKVQAFGVKFRTSLIDAKAQDVLIPMRDINGKLWNIQTITPASSDNKTYHPTKTQGLMHWLGPSPEKVIFICEGYATGASVAEATGKTVVCAFYAANLLPVAKAVREKYPTIKIIIAGDNDRYSKENIGRNKAVEAANAIGTIRPIFPRFKSIETKPTDFNDLHNLEGLIAVARQLSGGALEDRSQFNFVSFKELLKEPENPVEWLCKNWFMRGGTSLLVGPPKGGKTTLIRYLISCVNNGTPFLGVDVEEGRILYLALEEHRGQCIELFKTLKIKNPDNFILTFTSPEKTEEALARLDRVIMHYNPALVVVDTLFKLIKLNNGASINDYTPVVAALKPLEYLARDSGAHICCIHHSSKGRENTTASKAANGSTGIAAAFDAVISIEKHQINEKKVHKITADHRYGQAEDVVKVLKYNASTGECYLESNDPKEMKTELEIRSYLMENINQSFSISELSRNLTMPNRANLKRHVEGLRAKGFVLQSKGDKGAVLYGANPRAPSDSKIKKDEAF